LSEEIEGFQDFDTELFLYGNEDFRNEIYPAREDFAEIMATCLFLNEHDMKNANLGFSKTGRIIKIDGEYCFHELKKGYVSINNKVSSHDLMGLPNLNQYLPHHWFDVVIHGERKNYGYSRLYNLFDDPCFHRAVHRAILKIVILPNEFIRAFVECYESDEEQVEIRTQFLIQRRNMLMIAAYGMKKRFVDYVTLIGEEDFVKYLAQIKKFKTMGQYVLWDHVPNAEILITNNFFQLIARTNSLTLDFIKKWCRKSSIDVSKEYDDKKTILTLAAENKVNDVIIYLISTPSLCKKFTHDDMGRTLFILSKNKEYKLIKLICEKRADININNYITMPGGHSILQLIMMDREPELSVVQSFCIGYKGAALAYTNEAGETAILIANRMGHEEIVTYFLTTPDLYNQFTTQQRINFIKHPAIYVQLTLAQTLNILDDLCLRDARPLKEKQKSADIILKSAINKAETKDQLMTVISELENQETLNPFMKSYAVGCHDIRVSQWKSEKVSHIWVRLMDYAKQKMLKLLVSNNDFTDDDEIVNFLRTPTHKVKNFFQAHLTIVSIYNRAKDKYLAEQNIVIPTKNICY